MNKLSAAGIAKTGETNRPAGARDGHESSSGSDSDDDSSSGVHASVNNTKTDDVGHVSATDDDDDLFTVRRSVCTEPDVGESAEVTRANERRQTTRAALAKKLLNKKIVANERKRFDDDGNVSPDSLRYDILVVKNKKFLL